MTLTPAATGLPARRDHRVAPYTVVALASMALGLMTGRAERMAVGAAIAASVVMGFRRSDPLTVLVSGTVSSERVIVGTT